jgi:hypothetical protein
MNKQINASNVPRFASDLYVAPLEPIKPVASTTISNENEPKVQQQQHQPESTVTNVDFDWQGIDLINSLESKFYFLRAHMQN